MYERKSEFMSLKWGYEYGKFPYLFSKREETA
jgi:hypothetical protein